MCAGVFIAVLRRRLRPSPHFSCLLLASVSQRQKRKKTRWSKAERFDSTAKARRSENQGLSIQVYNYRRWTGDFNRLSIWRYRREPSSRRRLVSRKHRQVRGNANAFTAAAAAAARGTAPWTRRYYYHYYFWYRILFLKTHPVIINIFKSISFDNDVNLWHEATW